jgi:exportin-1
LTEIASLPAADIPVAYHGTLKALLVGLISRLVEIIPPQEKLVTAYDEGTEEDCLFISRLALFLSTYLRSHLGSFEASLAITGKIEHEEIVLQALSYAISISEVNDDEVFKTCLELWQNFAKDLYNSATNSLNSMGARTQLSTNIIGSPLVSFYEKFQVILSQMYVAWMC